MFHQFISQDGVFRPNEALMDEATGKLYELHQWTGAIRTLRPEQGDDRDRQDSQALSAGVFGGLGVPQPGTVTF